MNSKLDVALRLMSETDFLELRYRINTASWIRDIMKIYNLSDKDMSKYLQMSPLAWKNFKNGAYDYSVRDWSRLQALEMELGIEELKKKVENRIQVTSPEKTKGIE